VAVLALGDGSTVFLILADDQKRAVQEIYLKEIHRQLTVLMTLLCIAWLSSCSLPSTRPEVTSPPQKAPQKEEGAREYRIDPSASTLHILVYRGGTLAKLGHNHVVSSTTITGTVWRHATLARSGFEIRVPVNELIVDDDAARAAEGADFPLNVKEEAKQGTKHNMLSEALLDGVHYPDILIKSVSVSGDQATPQVVAALTIRDQTREVGVPVILEEQGPQLRIKGEFELRQTDFGITPFSVALGALQVVDTVKIRFELVANAG